jgi:hypothetical protein
MKASFTFDFDNLEDVNDHRRHTKALDLALCLNEFNTQLFAKLKCDEYDEMTSKEKALLFDMTELLQDTMKEYGIDLDTLLT